MDTRRTHGWPVPVDSAYCCVRMVHDCLKRSGAVIIVMFLLLKTLGDMAQSPKHVRCPMSGRLICCTMPYKKGSADRCPRFASSHNTCPGYNIIPHHRVYRGFKEALHTFLFIVSELVFIRQLLIIVGANPPLAGMHSQRMPSSPNPTCWVIPYLGKPVLATRRSLSIE
jgi:hypothetical protein